jgi:ADP-heptose:LPS heptosyltransferase/predicted SAM-dependent methyltransferase
MVWKIDGAQGAESKKIVWEAAPYLRGKGLDLGAGMFKIIPHAISVDSGDHAALFGHHFVAELKLNCEKLDIIASQSMDYVFSSHLLEHIEDHKAALKEWWRVIKQGGKLVLYLPHADFYPRMGQPGANPTHLHDFLPQDIIDAMKEISSEAHQFDLIDCQERNEGEEYSMFLVFRKIQAKSPSFTYKLDKFSGQKSALVCRFGAFGDLMQASSVFAGLKKQGYHVTLMTSLPGADVVSQDPHIDSVMLLDVDQIPNANLGDFWRYQAKKFDKFVNLSESVEGTFLAMGGRTPHAWPPALRHKMMNKNYVEFQHELAGVPHDPQVKFFATEDEKKWAKKERAKMDEFVVMWSLAGSSVHKAWAGLDNIMAALLIQYPTVHIVLVGGPECAMLEAGWEKESRVTKTCGKWSIRQSLSFITEANLLIGPETGVMNAAANEEVPKILFLSHSTKENLSRDWVNTTSLYGKGTKCKGRGDDEAPACHQMHYGFEHCTKDEESGTSQCQKDISVEEVFYHATCIIDIGVERMRA